MLSELTKPEKLRTATTLLCNHVCTGRLLPPGVRRHGSRSANSTSVFTRSSGERLKSTIRPKAAKEPQQQLPALPHIRYCAHSDAQEFKGASIVRLATVYYDVPIDATE